jgi:hypothetical protein
MELDLQDAFFAFLSACETTKGKAIRPDRTSGRHNAIRRIPQRGCNNVVGLLETSLLIWPLSPSI